MHWGELGYQAGMLGLAFVQSAIIGLERQARHKSAGFRTHILVGVASCLFTLISIYGFADSPSGRWDASRVAAQVVSGVGFLGAGVIFLHRDVVRGLTTAASVWLVSAVGMSCGAGMPQLGFIALLLHVVAVLVGPKIGRILPDLAEHRILLIDYHPGQGTLRQILQVFEERKKPFRVQAIHRDREAGRIRLVLALEGGAPSSRLVESLSGLNGVLSVETEVEEIL